MEKMGYYSYQFLELTLASADKPIFISHGRVSTFLTSSVDYLLISTKTGGENGGVTLAIHNTKKSDILLDPLTGNHSSLNDLQETPLLNNNFRVNIIEEKSEAYKGAQLLRFLPQVSGQILVL